MTTVRRIVDADVLSRIFTLPAEFSKRRIEVLMSPVEDYKTEVEDPKPEAPQKEPAIGQFLSGSVDWSEATEDELMAGYRAMAADTEYQRAAQAWCEGLLHGIDDDVTESEYTAWCDALRQRH